MNAISQVFHIEEHADIIRLICPVCGDTLDFDKDFAEFTVSALDSNVIGNVIRPRRQP
jgi:hypothetical protein